MTEEQGQPWGMCAAYGCPLPGSLGSGGEWWCFCHHERPSSANAAITEALRMKYGVLCRLSIALRARNEEDVNLCRQELKGASFGQELAFNKEGDKNAYGWSIRIERYLIEHAAMLGMRHRVPLTVQTSPVIGPTHAMQHYSEVQECEGEK